MTGMRKYMPPRGRFGAGLGFFAAAVILTAITLLLLTAPARAAGEPKPWEESAGLQTMCGDTLDTSARIFDSPDYQQQLLVPGPGTQAFLLGLKARSVSVLPKKSLTWQDDLPLVDASAATAAGGFTRDGGVVAFNHEGADWKIQPEPPLVGPLPLDRLLEAKPDYRHAADRYTPESKSVAALKAVGTDTKVTVFFGTWCTYCKHWLPRFIKTIEAAGNPKIAVEFVGMSEDQAEPKDLIRQYSVTMTPTFVVQQAGKEVGRIEENPKVSVEADLAQMLGGR